MSVPVWCELVCGMCSEHIVGGWRRTALDKTELIERAKEHGALMTKEEVYCGRDCLNQAAEERSHE